MTALDQPTLRTPDFDAYPSDRRLVGAETIDATTIALEWDDGRHDLVSPLLLRENAPGPETTSPLTRERVLEMGRNVRLGAALAF